MMTIDDDDVRSRLQSAMSELPVTDSGFEGVRRAGARRHRRAQVATTVSVLGLTAVAAIGVVAFVGHSPSAPKSVTTLNDPELRHEQRQMLAADASRAGAKLKLGPLTDSAGTWGFYATAQDQSPDSATLVINRLTVSRWVDDDQWRPVAQLYFNNRTLGPLISLRRGPTVAGDGVSVFGHVAGADNVPGATAVRIDGTWRWARFDGCGLPASMSEDCGTVKHPTEVTNEVIRNGTLKSEADNDQPASYDGTMYNLTWRWDPTKEWFAVTSRSKVGSGNAKH